MLWCCLLVLLGWLYRGQARIPYARVSPVALALQQDGNVSVANWTIFGNPPPSISIVFNGRARCQSRTLNTARALMLILELATVADSSQMLWMDAFVLGFVLCSRNFIQWQEARRIGLEGARSAHMHACIGWAIWQALSALPSSCSCICIGNISFISLIPTNVQNTLNPNICRIPTNVGCAGFNKC